jgi:hypothetical protein
MPCEEKKNNGKKKNRETLSPMGMMATYCFPILFKTEEGLGDIKIGGYLRVLLKKFF